MAAFVQERIERGENGVVLAPRGSTKTTSLNTGLLSFIVATNPDIRIGLFSQKDKKAESMSSAIRWVVSESEPFRELFGDLRSPVKWTDAEWLRKGSKWAASKDRTMVTGGVNNSSAVSKRFDLIFCHAPGTMILDPEFGEWMPVEEHPTASYAKADGKLLYLWGLPESEVVTNDHRYWARVRQEAGWVEARDLTGEHFIGDPIDMTVGEPHSIPVRVRSKVGRGWEYAERPQPEFADPDWWWLLGLWWGDGHRAKRMVGFTVSDELISDRITSTLDRYGYPWHRQPRDGCWQISFQSTRWAEWLTSWRSGNSMKQPPAWVERIEPRLQSSLIRGYIDADGFVDRRGREIRITSVHVPGLLAARRILARLGVPSSIRRGPGAGLMKIAGRVHPARQRFDLRFHDRYGPAVGFEGRSLTRFSGGKNRVYIEGGHLWSKVRAIVDVEDREFIPIQTASHSYRTAFGLSHNCDDVLDAENTYNIDRREKTEDWFWKTMKPAQAAEGVSIIVVGTRWTEGDLYERLIDTNHWPSLVIPAISRDAHGDDVSYWPEVWPLDRLYAERDDVGWDNFACSYLNDVRDREGFIFKRDWWDPTGYFDELPRDRRFLWTMGVDLASSERERADFTARVVVAEDEFHEHWIMSALQAKIESGHRQFVKDGAAAFPGISKIKIENNQHQSTLVQDLLNETSLPVVGVRADTEKRSRHRAIAARYESHRVHHHRSLKGGDLENQLTGYPKGHDDLLDALFLAMDITVSQGSIGAAATPQAPAGQEAQMTEVRFNTGAQQVPAYLASMLNGVDVARLTREEAIAAANRQVEANFIRKAMLAGLRR